MNRLLLLPSERRKGEVERRRRVHTLPSNSPIILKAFRNRVASLHPHLHSPLLSAARRHLQ